MWRVWVDSEKKIAYLHEVKVGTMMEFRTESLYVVYINGLIEQGYLFT